MKQPFSKSGRSTAAFGAVNLALVLGSASLLVWGGLYVGKYSGRFDPDEFSEIPHGRPPKVVTAAVDPAAETIKKGAKVYSQVCVACHQADGNGNPGGGIPPLAGSDWVLADGPNRIIRIVLHGLEGPVKVNGTTWGQNQMPPQAKNADNPAGLSPDDVALVLSYVRNAWGNKASLVTTEMVTAVAKETATQVGYWHPDDLLKLPATVGGGAPAGAPQTPDQLKAALKALPADQLEALLKEMKK